MIGRNETESDQTKGLIEIPADTTNRLNLIGASYSPDYNRTVVEENKYLGLDLDYRFDRDYALNILFRSDQFPFVLHNVPSFWWFTGFTPITSTPATPPAKSITSRWPKSCGLPTSPATNSPTRPRRPNSSPTPARTELLTPGVRAARFLRGKLSVG